MRPEFSHELKNADGTPMTPAQIQALMKERFDKLDPERRQEVTALQQRLTQERAMAAALAAQLDAAAAADRPAPSGAAR